MPVSDANFARSRDVKCDARPEGPLSAESSGSSFDNENFRKETLLKNEVSHSLEDGKYFRLC